jgi:hypothetical protein
MRVEIDKYEGRELIKDALKDVKRLEIWVSEDKCFRLDFNQFGELSINKQTYNEESSTITIKPSVSNEIKLI